MSLFDIYVPENEFKCSVCGDKLASWQGKDGPCGLFVWKEGKANPIRQQADESNLNERELRNIQLPKQFDIFCHDCSCSMPNTAKCTTSNGIWSNTTIVTATNAVQGKHETIADFKQRLQWLRSGS